MRMRRSGSFGAARPSVICSYRLSGVIHSECARVRRIRLWESGKIVVLANSLSMRCHGHNVAGADMFSRVNMGAADKLLVHLHAHRPYSSECMISQQIADYGEPKWLCMRRKCLTAYPVTSWSDRDTGNGMVSKYNKYRFDAGCDTDFPSGSVLLRQLFN